MTNCKHALCDTSVMLIEWIDDDDCDDDHVRVCIMKQVPKCN